MMLRAKIQRGLVVFIVTLVSLLLPFEVYLRISGDAASLEARRAHSILYDFNAYTDLRPRPNQSVRQNPLGEEILIETSALGYRADAILTEKPPDVTRIVMLGGSHVWDLYADHLQDWPHLVGAHLNQNGHPGIEVINAGVPGYTTANSLALLQFELWLYQPDFILVDQCWNDIKYFNDIAYDHSLVARGSAAERRPSAALNYVSSLDRLLGHSYVYDALREQYLTLRFGSGIEGLNPVDERLPGVGELGVRQYELSLAALVSFAREIGAEPLLVTQPRLVSPQNSDDEKARINYGLVGLSQEGLLAGFAACDAAIRKVAMREGVTVIDASAAMTGNPAYFVDHIHTTRAGSRELAEIVAQALDSVLPGDDR